MQRPQHARAMAAGCGNRRQQARHQDTTEPGDTTGDLRLAPGSPQSSPAHSAIPPPYPMASNFKQLASEYKNYTMYYECGGSPHPRVLLLPRSITFCLPCDRWRQLSVGCWLILAVCALQPFFLTVTSFRSRIIYMCFFRHRIPVFSYLASTKIISWHERFGGLAGS